MAATVPASLASLSMAEQPATKTPLPFWRRNNPFVQNLLISACLFSNPGLYLAIIGLGAGGGKPSSLAMSDISNGVLYGVFALSAPVTGLVLNTVGPQLATIFALTGYPVYIGAMWYYDVTGQLWFPVVAGAYLGLTAGSLWCTATFIANTYAEEKDKGTWRSIQWNANAAGAVTGGLVALGINWNATSSGVPHSVYITFIIMQCCSLIFALLMVSPETLIRPDGTPVATFAPVPVRAATHRFLRLFTDWRILALLPAFFAPEVFLVLQSSLNAYAYTLRARSLNSVLSYAVQIPFTVGMGMLLDRESLGSRRRRGFLGIGVLAVWLTGVYVAQTAWLAAWAFDRRAPGPAIDIGDAAYPGAAAISVLYGTQYGMFQNLVIWVLGSLSNQPAQLAVTGGLFVGVLSAGTAVSFGVDAAKVPYQNENAAWFALAVVSFPLLAWVTARCTHDTNYLKEEGVGVPRHVQEQLQVSQPKLERAAGGV